VGSALVRRLTALGYPVRVLTREVADAKRKVRSGGGVTLVSPAQWETAIKGCGAVVNLSGEPISTRWTPTIKREIMNSRVNTTNRLAVRVRAWARDSCPCPALRYTPAPLCMVKEQCRACTLGQRRLLGAHVCTTQP
jgi:hypothetical protein